MKREVLLSKLERVVNIIERDRDLPLDIKEVYTFGSFVRGKEEPGDLDLIMVHSELSPKQAELIARAIEGHGTSLDQQMNGRLKSNSENIDVVYGTSLEAVIHLLKVKPSTIEKIWSNDDRDWREKLRRIQSRSPDEVIGILERELGKSTRIHSKTTVQLDSLSKGSSAETVRTQVDKVSFGNSSRSRRDQKEQEFRTIRSASLGGKQLRSISSTLKGGVRPEDRRVESVLAVTCGFRFEVRPENEVVVLEADYHTVHVCVDCLTLLTVHRRIHHMKVEKVIVEMAERRPVLAEA